MPIVHTPAHPFIADSLARCRDRATTTREFRQDVAGVGRWLGYEICRDWLPMKEALIETPLGVRAACTVIQPDLSVVIVPILRAGLALVDGVLPLLPDARILHLGYRRDEKTARAQCYLDGLPAQMPKYGRVLVLEPMLATGGTLIQALDALTARGADIRLIRVLSVDRVGIRAGKYRREISRCHDFLRRRRYRNRRTIFHRAGPWRRGRQGVRNGVVSDIGWQISDKLKKVLLQSTGFDPSDIRYPTSEIRHLLSFSRCSPCI